MGGQNKCSVFGEELQTASDRSRHSFLELPEKIKVPRKGHQNNLLKERRKRKRQKTYCFDFQNATTKLKED